MNRLIAVTALTALLVGSTALAADTSRLGGGSTPPNHPGTEAPDSPADVLIAISTNGGAFTDLSPNYAAALTAAGAASTTTISDGANAPFAFPSPFTANEYGCIAILTTDNWHGPAGGGGLPESNCSLADEAAIAAYMDTGGAMLFSGQDYLFARGNGNGFPQIYLGIQTHVDDINFSDTDIGYAGVASSPLDGRVGVLHAAAGGAPCFVDNPFFSDDVTPFTIGLLDYQSFPSNVIGQGGTTWDTGVYRTVFTSVELACTTDTNQFHGDIAAIYNFLHGGTTSVEPSTWGAVKDMFSTR